MFSHMLAISKFVIGAAEYVPIEPGGGTGTSTNTTGGDYKTSTWWTNVVEPILKLLEQLIVPLLIILGTAGSIYVIILGVQFAKAETSDKREEAKKRMIHAVIGIVVMLVLLILLYLFTSNADKIFSGLKGDFASYIPSSS